MGTELFERVTATGSLVIRTLGGTRAGELAIHRFLSAPSVTCEEMLETLTDRLAIIGDAARSARSQVLTASCRDLVD